MYYSRAIRTCQITYSSTRTGVWQRMSEVDTSWSTWKETSLTIVHPATLFSSFRIDFKQCPARTSERRLRPPISERTYWTTAGLRGRCSRRYHREHPPNYSPRFTRQLFHHMGSVVVSADASVVMTFAARVRHNIIVVTSRRVGILKNRALGRPDHGAARLAVWCVSNQLSFDRTGYLR